MGVRMNGGQLLGAAAVTWWEVKEAGAGWRVHQ